MAPSSSLRKPTAAQRRVLEILRTTPHRCREIYLRRQYGIINAGAFTRMLHRLRVAGWIMFVDEPQFVTTYELTDAGRAALETK